MPTRISGATALALLLSAAPALAQNNSNDTAWTLREAIGDPDGLTVSGSARVRYEVLHNQFRPALDKNEDLVTTRITLAAQFDTGSFRIGGEIFDSPLSSGTRGVLSVRERSTRSNSSRPMSASISAHRWEKAVMPRLWPAASPWTWARAAWWGATTSATPPTRSPACASTPPARAKAG